VSTAAIVVGGGASTRLGGTGSKVLLPLGERSVLAWSLVTLQRCPAVDHVVLVHREQDREQIAAIVEQVGVTKLVASVAGGATRQDSELAGLEALAGHIAASAIDLVAIHDAARPFLTLALLDRVIDAARRHGGAVPALPVDAPLLLRRGSPHLLVPTDGLRRVQTPQVFAASALLDAYRRAATDGFHGVDTAETVERYSALEVVAVEGDPDNRKLTYPGDVAWAMAQTARLGG
jgi:2-C-methyl-D-erythritol 4-phosphate cytidylyltransferase